MSIDYKGGFDFSALQTVIDTTIEEAGQEAIEIVMQDAVLRAPLGDGQDGHDPGALRDSATLDDPIQDRGGWQFGFRFKAPWARKQHEHLYYKRHSEGGPKYAELAIVNKSRDAIAHVADRVREALGNE